MFPSMMIRSIACYIVFLICFIVIGCSSENQVKPLKPLHIATGDWEPFVGKNLPHNGPLSEMISIIMVDLHYVPEFKFYDWPMVEIHLASGYPNIAFPYIESKERIDKGFRFSAPLLKFNYVLFYHKKRNIVVQSIKSLNELKNIHGRIGLIRGYAKLPGIPNEAFKEVTSTVAGFTLLRVGNEIDFLLESKDVGLSLLESQYLIDDKNDFMYLGQPKGPNAQERIEFVSEVALRIMISPKLNPGILNDINDAIVKNKDKIYFKSLERKMKTRVNTLETGVIDAPSNEIIYGYPTHSGSTARFIIPRNSIVLITEWGPEYIEEEKKANESSNLGRSKVKLLNGPFKGRVMWVNSHYLTIER